MGIGATTAIFSVVDTVLLGSLPYGDPARLVMMYEDSSAVGFPHDTPAPGNFAEWRRQTQIFEAIAALSERDYNLTESGGEPEKLGGAAVTQNLFSVLGVKPVLGRVFPPEEDQPGAARGSVSHGLWKRRFAGDRTLIGREIC